MQPDQPTPTGDRERLRRLACGAISANLDAPPTDRNAAADEIAAAFLAEFVERPDEVARLLDIVRAKDGEIERLQALLAQAEQHARDTQDELIPEAADEAYQRGLTDGRPAREDIGYLRRLVESLPCYDDGAFAALDRIEGKEAKSRD